MDNFSETIPFKFLSFFAYFQVLGTNNVCENLSFRSAETYFLKVR